MSDDLDAAMLARTDQREAEATSQARAIASYYRTLVDGNVPLDLAGDLTRTWANQPWADPEVEDDDE